MATTQSADAAPSPSGEPKFEALVAELEKLVGQLEAGTLPLEDSLAAFERGMGLSQQAAALLDAADAKVELLTAGPAGPKLEPFST